MRVAIVILIGVGCAVFHFCIRQPELLKRDLAKLPLATVYTAFLEAALTTQQKFVRPFEGIDINENCRLDPNRVCILVVSDAGNSVRRKTQLASLVRRNMLAVPPNVIIVDQRLLDAMLLYYRDDIFLVAKFKDILAQNRTDDEKLAAFIDRRELISYWRLITASRYLNDSYPLEREANQFLAITGVADTSRFGTVISWLLFHEVGHLAHHQAAEATLLSSVSNSLNKLVDRSYFRRQEDGADRFANDRLKELVALHAESPDAPFHALAIASMTGFWRAKSLIELFNDFRGIPTEDLFYEVSYKPCSMYVSTLNAPTKELVRKAPYDVTLDLETIEGVRLRNSLTVTKEEFEKLQMKYVDLVQRGTHGFGYRRIAELNELFPKNSVALTVMQTETMWERRVIRALELYGTWALSPFESYEETKLDRGSARKIFGEWLHGRAKGRVRFDIAQGRSCDERDGECELWIVKLDERKVAIIEPDFSDRGSIRTITAYIYLGSMAFTDKHDDDEEREEVGLAVLIHIASSIEEMLSAPIQVASKMSPKFWERVKNEVQIPESERLGAEVTRPQKAAIGLAVMEEVRRKNLLCHGGSWIGTDGKHQLLVSARSSPWVRIDYYVPHENAMSR